VALLDLETLAEDVVFETETVTVEVATPGLDDVEEEVDGLETLAEDVELTWTETLEELETGEDVVDLDGVTDDEELDVDDMVVLETVEFGKGAPLDEMDSLEDGELPLGLNVEATAVVEFAYEEVSVARRCGVHHCKQAVTTQNTMLRTLT